MSKIEIKKIVKKYVEKLKAKNYPFFEIYLFGSSVKGKTSEQSDIDVAIVTDKIKKNIDKNRLLLWQLRRDVDIRIEPHSFTVKDFQSQCDPMVYEIKKTGVKIV